jgi:hypothetical protein
MGPTAKLKKEKHNCGNKMEVCGLEYETWNNVCVKLAGCQKTNRKAVWMYFSTVYDTEEQRESMMWTNTVPLYDIMQNLEHTVLGSVWVYNL